MQKKPTPKSQHSTQKKIRNKTTRLPKNINIFDLYEQAVQSPKSHVNWFVSVYKDIRGKYARFLREDFCGTALICCEWVNRNSQNHALGIDLDPAPLAHSKKKHFPELTLEQRKRINLLSADVLNPPSDKMDLIVACNFSFFIFKERAVLKRYFMQTLKSLKKDGVFLLELAGGPGMIEPIQESKPIFHNGKRSYSYIWHQKSFDPIHRNAQYGIHFKFPDGQVLKDVFTYDWRLWTIPELRDLLAEAGFVKTIVYWEATHQGAGTGEYIATEKGDNAHAWVSYIAALA